MVEYSLSASAGRLRAIKDALEKDPSLVDSLEPAVMSAALHYSEQPLIQEIVEGNLPQCSHNVLLSKKTGAIIDLTGGQFTGTMQPATYNDLRSFKAALPGRVLHFRECPESEVQEQIERDTSTARTYRPFDPKDWAPHVVENSLSGLDDGTCWETVCRGCLGMPKDKGTLKRCMRCKLVLYCCKECQSHDWKRNRHACGSTKVTK